MSTISFIYAGRSTSSTSPSARWVGSTISTALRRGQPHSVSERASVHLRCTHSTCWPCREKTLMTRSRSRIVYSYFKADPFVETNGLTTWATRSTRPSRFSFPHTTPQLDGAAQQRAGSARFTEYRHDISDTFAFWRSIKCCLCPIRRWRRNRAFLRSASRDHALYLTRCVQTCKMRSYLAV